MVGYVYSIYLPLKPSETKVIHTKVVDKCYIVPLGCDPNALSEVKSFEENCHFLLSMLSLGYFGAGDFKDANCPSLQGLKMTRKCSCISEGGKSSTAKQQQVHQIMDATATERKTQHHFDKLWGRLMDIWAFARSEGNSPSGWGGIQLVGSAQFFRKISLLEVVIELGPNIRRHTHF